MQVPLISHIGKEILGNVVPALADTKNDADLTKDYPTFQPKVKKKCNNLTKEIEESLIHSRN